MNDRRFNARQLDVSAFAQARARLEGQWLGVEFARLQQGSEVAADGIEAAGVNWQAQGEMRAAGDGLPAIGLALQASTNVRVRCQRCLQPISVALAVQTRFRFAATEDEAERLDPDSDDDILVVSQSLDLHALVEDELILAMPSFPRHDACVPPGDAQVDAAAANPKPFAALAALRGTPPPDSGD